MIAVLSPSWADRIAATYPPGPAPRTTTSKCVLMPRTILRRERRRAAARAFGRHGRQGRPGGGADGRPAPFRSALAVQVGHLGRVVTVAGGRAHRDGLFDGGQVLLGQFDLQSP